jgi:hypothetical protein
MYMKSQIILTTRFCKTEQNTGYVDLKRAEMHLTGDLGEYAGYLRNHFS